MEYINLRSDKVDKANRFLRGVSNLYYLTSYGRVIKLQAMLSLYVQIYMHTYTYSMDPLVCYEDSRMWHMS